jgi:UDP-N-acetylglucosamine 1-carboxyvinyltransferase
MLARFKKVSFADLPGGCTLGVRSLTPHYEALTDLGVKVHEDERSAKMDANKAKATTIFLREMSPTVTENVVMLATGLKGKTIIHGAASEPQVQDLCMFLLSCGAKIEGIGSNLLTIEGRHPLKPVPYKMLSDHYEIATFLALAAATGGKITINDVPEYKLIAPIINTFKLFGVDIKIEGNKASIGKKQKIKIKAEKGYLQIKAQPWPALPVDALPLFIPLALAADKGQVLFHNWMYESGLFWTSELLKMGANIIMADPHRVIVNAGTKLYGAKLEAPYIIRAVVALAMTAMIASGESKILNADALYRGHPNFVTNLRRLGAQIEELQ